MDTNIWYYLNGIHLKQLLDKRIFRFPPINIVDGVIIDRAVHCDIDTRQCQRLHVQNTLETMTLLCKVHLASEYFNHLSTSIVTIYITTTLLKCIWN